MVSTAGAIIITVLVLAAVAIISWVLYSRWRAQKLGLPPPSLTSFIPFRSKSASASSYNPSPRAGGIQGWIGDQITKYKNRNNRTATGAYEGAPAVSRGVNQPRGGFGALDPDAAWDTRVGDEADYGGYDAEEHEMGLSGHGDGPYGRNSTAYEGAAHGGRGGPLGGSLGTGHDDSSYAMNLAATPRDAPAEETRGRGAVRQNPFDDDAAEPSNISLRGVSPRPMEGEHQSRRDNSPTGRRSIFTEDV